jgi:lipoprotein
MKGESKMKRSIVKKRRHAFMLPVLGLIACLACGCVAADDPQRFYAENRETLEKAACEILEKGDAGGVSIQGIESVSYWAGENQVVEFITSACGSVPASTYKGIYYSASGEPAAFQNADVALTQTETGWAWGAEGDNRGTTARIEGNWFEFEAVF